MIVISNDFVSLLEFLVLRDEANGGNLKFQTYNELEKYFAEQKLHPADLKASVETYINKLLDPIRKIFERPDLKKLATDAYPVPKKQSKRIPFTREVTRMLSIF